MKKILIFILFIFICSNIYSQSSSNVQGVEEDSIEYNNDIKFGIFNLEDLPILFNLNDRFKFVNGPYAKEIMIEGWGNTPEAVKDVIGMIIPDTTSSPYYINKGYIVSYQEIGHVIDKDGKNLNLKDILDVSQVNENGEKVKWAWEPAYDTSGHYLSLPLVYESKNSSELYHQIKIFSRNGVVTLQSINDIHDLPWLKENYKDIIKSISFTQGNAYNDYTLRDDKIAFLSIEEFLSNKPAKGLQSVEGDFDLEYDSIRIMGLVAAGLLLIMLILMGIIWATNPQKETHNDISKLSVNVLLRTGVFYIVYFLIFIFALFLIWLGVEITIGIVKHVISIRIILIILFGWLIILGFLYSVVSSIFAKNKKDNKYQKQIKEKDAPELFSLIKEMAEKTGQAMPEKVFLTPELNASVFYNRSLIGIFFSKAKNINIGIGLLYGLSKDELRAVLAHEFGHFGQKSMRMGQIVAKNNSVIASMIDGGAFIVKPILKWTFMYVQRGFLALSRAMEKEADIIAAETIGNDIMISSLCKIDVMQGRFDTYNNLMIEIYNNRKFIPESYFIGYETFLKNSEYYDGLQIDEDTALNAPALDNTESRIKLKNIWVSHPPLKERIKNIQSKERSYSHDSHEEIVSIVPKHIEKEISDIIYGPSDYSPAMVLDVEAYEKELKKELVNRTICLSLRPYFHRNIYPFDIEAEMNTPIDVKYEEVFNKRNSKLINSFNQEIEDYQTLILVKEHNIGENVIRYDGHIYKRENVPVDEQYQRIKVLEPDIISLDKKAFHVAISKGVNKQLLIKAYDNIFHSQAVISIIKKDIIPTRDMAFQKIGKGSQQSEEEYNRTQQILLSIREFMKKHVNTFELQRLYPVLQVDMAKELEELHNPRLLDGFSIASSEIEYIFNLPDKLILLYEYLSHFYKKIITDILEDKEPIMFWENTIAQQQASEGNIKE